MPNIPGTRCFQLPFVWGPHPGNPKYTPVQFLYMAFLKWGGQIDKVRRSDNTIKISLYDVDADVFEEVKLAPSDV